MNYFGGIEILENPYIVDKVRVKRNRKKRIDKKWLKRYGYREVPKKEAVLFKDPYGGTKLLIHPYYYEALKLEIGMREVLKNEALHLY